MSPVHVLLQVLFRFSETRYGDDNGNATDLLPVTNDPRRTTKSRRLTIPTMLFFSLCGIMSLYLIHATGFGVHFVRTGARIVRKTYIGISSFDWRGNASFHVTEAMKVSIGMSMALGILLGIGVGIISGLEPAVVIGVSASMAMGCVFVMSFAILHGVNALRAVVFAIFVSVCLPFGFGFGFGIGILIGVFLGLEHPDDIREKTKDFVNNFGDFVRVVTAFTLEIL